MSHGDQTEKLVSTFEVSTPAELGLRFLSLNMALRFAEVRSPGGTQWKTEQLLETAEAMHRYLSMGDE